MDFSLLFFALGNKLLPHIEATDPEPPGSGLKGSTRRGKKDRGHPECEELVWVASHLSVSAVHSLKTFVREVTNKEILAPKNVTLHLKHVNVGNLVQYMYVQGEKRNIPLDI